SETNQQVSDFYTTEGSVNGSLTDRHYAMGAFSLCRIPQQRSVMTDPLSPVTKSHKKPLIL
ncbi:hypothetical protein, partial [Aeromonas veronii]|uniref:hypothetical protein n=1 Tax=Aeromonas veronii TaxID=654 RepID=UPI003D1F41FC